MCESKKGGTYLITCSKCGSSGFRGLRKQIDGGSGRKRVASVYVCNDGKLCSEFVQLTLAKPAVQPDSGVQDSQS
jgi:hypothetical protein